MKRLLILLSILLSATIVTAQEQEKSTLYIDQSGENSVTTNNGALLLNIAGLNLEFGDKKETLEPNYGTYTSKSGKVNLSYSGSSKTSIDHIALIELGTNVLANADYSLYTPEEAVMLPFGNRKSVYCAINLITMSAALTKNRALGFEMGFGFGIENYAFAGKYSMEYREGMMHPIALEGDQIKKSQLQLSYIHMPFLLNWNIKHKFFIAAGVNLDIGIGSALRYKKPRTIISGTVTVNPIQVGATARIGYGKLYGFVNYSFMEMFKRGTGPGGNRLSAGVGLFF